jgi:hypothetical protein
MKHVRIAPIDLKASKEINEVWIHDRIAEDPSILGLGDVAVRDRERIHPGAGRLDMLLQDTESTARYEVEIQLGPTDPSHIIRTLEYWDIERKRYPQYEQLGVIIAEDITSRFLNVISLFNGSIPIIAIQMRAVQMPDGVGLIFTKILDATQRGLEDEDEEAYTPADRAYWESRATPAAVKMADHILELTRSFAPSDIQLTYKKPYIGFQVGGKSVLFALCRPRKNTINLEVRLPQSPEMNERLEKSGVPLLEYQRRWGCYRIRLAASDLTKHREVLQDMLQAAYRLRNND